jgi:hypothetical protein
LDRDPPSRRRGQPQRPDPFLRVGA